MKKKTQKYFIRLSCKYRPFLLKLNTLHYSYLFKCPHIIYIPVSWLWEFIIMFVLLTIYQGSKPRVWGMCRVQSDMNLARGLWFIKEDKLGMNLNDYILQ